MKIDDDQYDHDYDDGKFYLIRGFEDRFTI